MRRLFVWSVILLVFLTSCAKLEVYEKIATFPRHEWASGDKKSFTFNIPDSTSPYNIWLVVRHEDAYNYRNIWLNIEVKEPDTSYTIRREFMLAGNNRWLGTGMDDVFEERVNFAALPRLKKGDYTFTLQQIMREDPLQHLLNVGIRVQKGGIVAK
jgi:gliding motility-associated lipoprotein GldH